MKVIIIGSPGAGKSTFTTALKQKLHYPVLHLDALWHTTDYSNQAKEWLIQQQEDFMNSHNDWIIDGNYLGTLPLRLQYADTIIWLKVSPKIAVLRVLKRSFKRKFLHQIKPDMAKSFKETFDKEYLEFLKFVFTFKREKEPTITELLKKNVTSQTVFMATSKKEKQKILKKLTSQLED